MESKNTTDYTLSERLPGTVHSNSVTRSHQSHNAISREFETSDAIFVQYQLQNSLVISVGRPCHSYTALNYALSEYGLMDVRSK